MRAASGRAGREIIAATLDWEDEDRFDMLKDKREATTDCTEVEAKSLNDGRASVVAQFEFKRSHYQSVQIS